MKDTQQFFEELKIGMKLKELISDRERIIRVGNSGNDYALEQCLREMYYKYFVEGIINGAISSNPAPTLQGQAEICINLLNRLILAKSGEFALEVNKG